MNYILFDGPSRNTLLPFTFTRPVADIRIGVLTIREKWEKYLRCTTTTVTEAYLSDKYPMVEMEENIFINASFLPNKELVELIKNLQQKQAIFYGEDVVAFFALEGEEDIDFAAYEAIEFTSEIIQINHTWDIFSKNAAALQSDFDLITEGRKSHPISKTNNVIAPENIFIEKGAAVEFCTLNASTGPIYIGKNATMLEGSLVRGGLALCENAVVKMGAKIYGATTVGPYCKVGGEINNAVLFDNSNKGHEGYLGNAVIGAWCNLGADTNNSNLKNNYAQVKLWDYEEECFVKTGLQFCGLVMGDHSKCGINTMFNTGTVVGVFANIFGTGYPRNFIPSFSWGGPAGFTVYKTEKAFETAQNVCKRRGIAFSDEDKEILWHVFQLTEKWRNGYF